MITPEIQQYVQSEIERAAKKSQISVPKVPFHTHNNIDSPTLPLTNTVASVSSIIAGTNVTISPIGGTGAVTVNSSAVTGVTSLSAGTGIGVSGSTGAVTVSNTGVTSLIAGTNISLSGSTGAVTVNATGGGGFTAITTGQAAKTLSDATVTQTIAHGLGKTPTFVRMDGSGAGSSADIFLCNSTFDGTISNYVASFTVPGGGSIVRTGSGAGGNFLVALDNNGSANGQIATITVDSTNLYLAWVKNGSGLAQGFGFVWVAMG